MEIGSLRIKTGLAEMLKGGVIMDVTNAEQAKIAEDAGAAGKNECHRKQSNKSGVNVKIFPDTTADTGDHSFVT